LTVHPSSSVAPRASTRAQTNEEVLIEEVSVLVFSGGNFLYYENGTDISSGENASTNFKVDLRETDKAVTLIIIANANTEIQKSGIVLGDTESSVKSKLSAGYAGACVSPFPMYGVMTLPSVTSSTVSSGGSVTLKRAIASAEITVAEGVSNFKLETLQIFRVNSLIQIIPNEASPSVPSGASPITSGIYNVAEGNHSSGQLYFPESMSPTEAVNATCIIAGGTYTDTDNTTSTQYYRIDFNTGTNSSIGEIRRNTKYIFNVTKVAQKGASTAKEAAGQLSSNINVTIDVWDEKNTDVMYDKDYHLTLSSRTIKLRPWAHTFSQPSSLSMETNIPASQISLQWCNENGQPLEGSIPAATISNDYFTLNLESPAITAVPKQNNAEDEQSRISHFLINAGQWSVQMKVEQYGTALHKNHFVRLLSFNSYGNLGSGLGADHTTTGADALALRSMLNVQFSMTGKFKFGGYWFTEYPVMDANSAYTDDVLNQYDVILASNYNLTPGKVLSEQLIKWVKTPNRVLIICKDADNTNNNIMDAAGDIPNAKWITTGGTTKFNIEVNNATALFTNNDIFGSVNTGSYFSGDGTEGRAESVPTTVTPLLTMDGDGKMVMGVNMNRRIIYLGESQIFYSAYNNLSNNDGNISNDKDKFMASLWAWITETVLLGKNS
jgi:hypothetical protein